MNAAESAELIKKFVSVPQSQVVKNVSEINVKAPLVLKILSKDAVHKTDVGGVKIVMNQELLGKSFDELVNVSKFNKMNFEGIYIQEFVKGVETIIGIKRDPIFGPMIVFGLGGVFAEVLKDTSTRRCPISLDDAQEMIDSLKSSKIFYGFRGMKVNFNNLKKSLVEISKLPEKYKEVEELDINPFILTEKKGFAADARVVIRSE